MKNSHLIKLLTLAVVIIGIQFWVEYSRNHTQNAEVSSANLTSSLSTNLQKSAQLNPLTYISDTKSWDQFSASADTVLDLSQTLLNANNHGEEPDLDNLYAAQLDQSLRIIIENQSSIKKQQKEFMRLRSLSDNLEFKISKSVNINQLIINSRQGLSGSLNTNKRLYRLQHHLTQLASHLSLFWLDLNKQKIIVKHIESELDSIDILSTELMDGKNALKAHAERKGMAEISRYATDLRNNLSDLNKAIKTIRIIVKAQETIDHAATTAINSMEHPDSRLSSNNYHLIIQGGITAALLTFIALTLANKPTPPANHTSNRTQHTTSDDKPTDQVLVSKDIDKILDAMEKAQKGNITSKADDKQTVLRDLAINYNQLMSTLTRRLISIHQQIAKISELIDTIDNSQDDSNPDKQTTQPELQELINPTFEIAASIDQIERKMKNNEVTISFLSVKMSSIDRQQALLKVRLRDLFEERTDSEDSFNKGINKELKDAVTLLRKDMSFFQLERRL